MAAVARRTRQPKRTEAEQLQDEQAVLRQQIKAAKRLRKIKLARDNLIDFVELMMPDPEDPDDAERSRYKPALHHRALAAQLEEVEKGNCIRLIITMPPRHGKSEEASRMFPAWFLGRDPYRQVMIGGYSETFAEKEFGAKIKRIIQSQAYKQVFPLATLEGGSTAVDNLVFAEGGNIASIGRKGATTGRGADLFIIDDPVKDRMEANSKTIRDQIWDWYNDVVKTRLVNEFAAVIIIMTRWHEDDLVGRLTDPKNPNYPYHGEENPWTILDLPALALENDPLGRRPGEALWPERFSVAHLRRLQKEAPATFSALYQGRPTPEDGTYFKREWLIGYQPHELPRNLVNYGASDHAPGAKEDGDKNVAGIGGIDENGVLWIRPDLFWQKAETDVTVEAMIDQMERHRPLFWWGENEHILKSIGPFLRKRMLERKVYCAVVGSSAAKDHMTRARAFQGRVAMKMVRFPVFAPWWQDAMEELLQFPNGRSDDFVSFCAHLGRGIDQMVGQRPKLLYAPKPEPVSGTMAWVKWADQEERRQQKLLAASEGW